MDEEHSGTVTIRGIRTVCIGGQREFALLPFALLLCVSQIWKLVGDNTVTALASLAMVTPLLRSSLGTLFEELHVPGTLSRPVRRALKKSTLATSSLQASSGCMVCCTGWGS